MKKRFIGHIGLGYWGKKTSLEISMNLKYCILPAMFQKKCSMNTGKKIP